jgi:DNA-binding NarL/FixJ family response regulator
MTAPHARSSAPIRILVVDDHPAVREGLALLVSSAGMEVCAEAGSRAEGLASAVSRPHLAVIDLSLDGEDGQELIAQLRSRGVPALVYSMHGDAAHVQGAFAAGALGYVTKSEFRGVLVEAIRAVAAGKRFVSPRAAIALADRATEPHVDESPAHLSAQEREVYRLLGQGEGTHEIAAALDISTHTVESYYARIQQKLRLEGMYELRRHAIDEFRRPTPS